MRTKAIAFNYPPDITFMYLIACYITNLLTVRMTRPLRSSADKSSLAFVSSDLYGVLREDFCRLIRIGANFADANTVSGSGM